MRVARPPLFVVIRTGMGGRRTQKKTRQEKQQATHEGLLDRHCPQIMPIGTGGLNENSFITRLLQGFVLASRAGPHVHHLLPAASQKNRVMPTHHADRGALLRVSAWAP